MKWARRESDKAKKQEPSREASVESQSVASISHYTSSPTHQPPRITTTTTHPPINHQLPTHHELFPIATRINQYSATNHLRIRLHY